MHTDIDSKGKWLGQYSVRGCSVQGVQVLQGLQGLQVLQGLQGAGVTRVTVCRVAGCRCCRGCTVQGLQNAKIAGVTVCRGCSILLNCVSSSHRRSRLFCSLLCCYAVMGFALHFLYASSFTFGKTIEMPCTVLT